MSQEIKAFALPPFLKACSHSFLFFWCLLAAFPIVWIMVMSIKLPVDSFDGNVWRVIIGPQTIAQGKGISIIDGILYGCTLVWIIWQVKKRFARWVTYISSFVPSSLAWLLVCMCWACVCVMAYFVVIPWVASALNQWLGFFGKPILGFTFEHYQSIWIEKGFSKNFWNSVIVTTGVVCVSLSVGTLAGYALSRSGAQIALWILIIALIFRALPHSVLVAGYLPWFINSAEILQPLFGENAPTLYGQPIAVIAVLVAINQPFTIWMLHSFFQSIPEDLDEAARIDGCSHFQAFYRVILPVMWPGVITTGLFAFLLGYNDYLVCSLLLDAQNQTMVPAITGFFNRETTTTDQVEAVAAAVSITAPLLILVMVFQRQIVSGLTQGAVKG